MAFWMQKKADELVFKVRVVPRASKSGAAGLFDDAIKLRLAAPPVDGAANRECINFLSKALKVPKASILIVHGQTGRTKTLCVKANPDSAARIAKCLQDMADGQVHGDS